MGRYAHDGAGTIVRQNVIRQPDRHLRAVQRIDGIASGKYAGLLLVLETVHGGSQGSLINIVLHCRPLLVRSQFLCQSVLGSQNHEGSAVEGVGTGGIDGNHVVGTVNLEVDLGTIALSDPVRLHLLNLLRPLQLIQIIQKTICVIGNSQHPLFQVLLGHVGAAPLTLAVDHFLIGQSGLAGGTPVDGHLLLIGQALLEHLYKNPLGPLVELRIRGVYFHIPVIDRRDLVDLALDILDILRGGFRRMYAHLDGVVLRRKSESVPSHGMDHIISVHQLVAAPHVGDHIASPVSHMKSVSGRIGEHIQAIVFLLLAVIDIYRVLFPISTPFLLNHSVIIWYSHCLSSS